LSENRLRILQSASESLIQILKRFAIGLCCVIVFAKAVSIEKTHELEKRISGTELPVKTESLF
jgi:hypothetical protein